jgi:hypothetical protein
VTFVFHSFGQHDHGLAVLTLLDTFCHEWGMHLSAWHRQRVKTVSVHQNRSGVHVQKLVLPIAIEGYPTAVKHSSESTRASHLICSATSVDQDNPQRKKELLRS